MRARRWASVAAAAASRGPDRECRYRRRAVERRRLDPGGGRSRCRARASCAAPPTCSTSPSVSTPWPPRRPTPFAATATSPRSVIDVLRDAGVERDDIQTGNFSMQPQYNEDGTQVTGYAVSNLVTATIRDLEETGTIIDAAAAVAGDEIVVNNLTFSFDDNTELIESARAQAVKRAQVAARQLAHAAHVELGNAPVAHRERGTDRTHRRAEAFRLSAEAAATPIEPGSQTLSVLVTLVYEIS